MEKKCTKCGEVKSLDEFTNAKKGKHGKNARCKSCDKLYYKSNKERIKQRQKGYYLKNKKDILNNAKRYREDNSENIKRYREDNSENQYYLNKEWRKKNKKKVKKYHKKYRVKHEKRIKERRKKNKEKIKEYNLIYRKENKEKINGNFRIRKETDLLFRLRCRIKCNVITAIKNQGYTKNTKTFNILKCEYNFFMDWLNGKASNGYTYGIGDLHLDHVIPISLAQTEDEAILLSHYSNYQLLSADENLAKSNSYVNPTNLKRVLNHHPEPNKIKEIYSRL